MFAVLASRVNADMIGLFHLDLPAARVFCFPGNKSVCFRENHAVCSKGDRLEQYGEEEGQLKSTLLEMAPVCAKLRPCAGNCARCADLMVWPESLCFTPLCTSSQKQRSFPTKTCVSSRMAILLKSIRLGVGVGTTKKTCQMQIQAVAQRVNLDFARSLLLNQILISTCVGPFFLPMAHVTSTILGVFFRGSSSTIQIPGDRQGKYSKCLYRGRRLAHGSLAPKTPIAHFNRWFFYLASWAFNKINMKHNITILVEPTDLEVDQGFCY